MNVIYLHYNVLNIIYIFACRNIHCQDLKVQEIFLYLRSKLSTVKQKHLRLLLFFLMDNGIRLFPMQEVIFSRIANADGIRWSSYKYSMFAQPTTKLKTTHSTFKLITVYLINWTHRYGVAYTFSDSQ